MKSKINFTAIIAVAMIAMSVVVLGSCNAEDDDYNFEYGTLAKGVMTRSGDYDGISDNIINVNVIDQTFQVEFNEKNTPVTVSVEIKVDTISKKSSCKIKKCDIFEINQISATAKNFDFNQGYCDMEIVINSTDYGEGKGKRVQVRYTK